jgi:hypothetical protein
MKKLTSIVLVTKPRYVIVFLLCFALAQFWSMNHGHDTFRAGAMSALWSGFVAELVDALFVCWAMYRAEKAAEAQDESAQRAWVGQ